MKRSKRRTHRGGQSTSATTYVMDNYGTQDKQYQQVFGPDPAPNAYANYVVNLNHPNTLPASVPQGPSKLMGGRRRRGNMTRRKSRKSKRGGFLGDIISQAVVPFGLVALQQSMKKRSRGHNKTYKHRR